MTSYRQRSLVRWAAAVAGVVVALLTAVSCGLYATQISYGTVRERDRTCNRLLPLPGTAYWCGWTGLALAAATFVVCAVILVRYKRSGRTQTSLGIVAALTGVSAFATLIAALERALHFIMPQRVTPR